MATTTTAKTTEATSALTDAIVSGVKQSQDLMLSGISAWVDFTGKAFNAPKVEGAPLHGLAAGPEGVRRRQLRLRRGAAQDAEGIRVQARRRRAGEDRLI